MNRLFLAVSALVLSVGVASAQNMYDGINVSRNEYFGTARSMGLGNAVTAVGGDLGMIGINPAGSAVANYGQFVVTPGVSLSIVEGSYYPEAGMLPPTPFASRRKEPVMSIPNIGVSTVLNTGRSRGVKSFSFAFVSNQTRDFNYSSSVLGENSQTSKIAEFAAGAAGWDESILQDYSSYESSSISWDILTAYQAGMFGSYGNGNNYVGVSEALEDFNHFVPSALAQRSVVVKNGTKDDMILNFGMNISDQLFVGVNMGMPSATYSVSETFIEAAKRPEDFPISFAAHGGGSVTTYFNSGSYVYDYAASYDGLYGKLGVIYLPSKNLRIGAAIQTPTIYSISEEWQYSASTSFVDSSFDDRASSPIGSYEYNLVSPYVINLGIAWTFAHRVLWSMDYEMTDYSGMRFMADDDEFGFEDPFYDLNETNRNFAGASHELRLGAEYRITPQFSVRAGYSFLTSPEKYWQNDLGEDVFASDYLDYFDNYYTGTRYLVSDNKVNEKSETFAFGIGYSSAGSFFADAVVKANVYPLQRYYPYYDYDNFNAYGEMVNALSPEIHNYHTLVMIAVSFGWRF